jgi:hypothetical protein
MVHIYYHIYGIDGVESIIDEQLSLIKTYFDFTYILNIGISIGEDDVSTSKILEKFTKPNYKIRDVNAYGNEWTTLDLIEKDKEKFSDSDYIFYIHTKGASKQNSESIVSWRHLMNYFNIEKVKNVFKLFEETEFNTYGVHYITSNNRPHYSGNFWWMRSDYAKTINVKNVDKSNRYMAELGYLRNGVNWKPYSAFDPNLNLYLTEIKREQYAI